MKQYHNKYKFFKEEERDKGSESVLAIMRQLKYQKVPAGKVLFEEGELGDRFYLILKGTVSVEIARESAVNGYTHKLSTVDKVKAYLAMVYWNQETIFWPRVPYAKKIRHYFRRIDHDKRIFVKLIMNELYEILGKRFLYVFQWLNKAKEKKNKDLEIQKNSFLK